MFHPDQSKQFLTRGLDQRRAGPHLKRPHLKRPQVSAFIPTVKLYLTGEDRRGKF